MPEATRAVSNLAMYVFAKEHYLKTLLSTGRITQDQYEQMNKYLYDRFDISAIDDFDISVIELQQPQPIHENPSDHIMIQHEITIAKRGAQLLCHF